MRIFIFHGTLATSQSHWVPWMKEKLEQQGLEVVTPDFPSPEGQTLSNWLNVMQEYLPLQETDILIGNSMGSGFGLQLLLDRIAKNNEKVDALFLCSSFAKRIGLLKEIDDLNSTFVDEPIDVTKALGSFNYAHCYHGSDDPYVPLEMALDVADGLQCDLTVIYKGGHLNTDAGYTKFELLLESILSYINKKDINKK